MSGKAGNEGPKSHPHPIRASVSRRLCTKIKRHPAKPPGVGVCFASLVEERLFRCKVQEHSSQIVLNTSLEPRQDRPLPVSSWAILRERTQLRGSRRISVLFPTSCRIMEFSRNSSILV